MGNGRGMPKPAASCTTTVMPGMVVKTQLTSAVADKAQQGVMELLLINHPLDCPVCDKGGECPLQNQAMSNERGADQEIGTAPDTPFHSYFSGNTVQICPVGALTGASYRFRARPFDLQSTPSVCEHCASGCQQRTDWRRGKVLRRLAGADPDVNEEWNCDKGRWAFQYATAKDRLTTPLVRDDEGYLVEASWSEALERAAAGLTEHRGKTGVLTGGRLT